MTRLLAEWLWRIVIVALLVWIGIEVHALHEDMMAPEDDQPETTAAPADLRDGQDLSLKGSPVSHSL